MTSGVIHHPHDKLVKRSMRQLEIAREFFEQHLPPDILKRVDLSTLKVEDKSFIDDAFKKAEADLVYTVQLDGSTAYFYLLCENQSDVDAHMPFRLLVYTVHLLQDHLVQHPQQPLPIVFPLVLYSGEKPWTAPPDIFPLFGAQADLARSLWSQPYTLIDIHRITDNELKRRHFSGLVEYVLKHHQTRDIERCLTEIFAWLDRAAQKDLPQTVLLGKNILLYFCEVNKTADRETFNRLAEQHLSSTALRGEVMTLAQQFRQEGRQEGEAAVIIHLMTRRFGQLPEDCVNRLQQADTQQLLHWSEKVLEAKALQDIFD